MVVTDKERRETAENLRYLSTNTRVWYKEQFFDLLDETVMEPDLGYHEISSVFERLADLIDRPKCHNVYDDSARGSCENGFECSECGELVEDAEHYYVAGTWNYCPGCGREVLI